MKCARSARSFSSLTQSALSVNLAVNLGVAVRMASVHRNAKSRDLLLNRHSTIESINEVMKNMTKNGKLNEMPNNATFVTTLELAKSTAYDYSGLSYYTEPSGRYLILVEENDHFMPWISLRLPSDSLHDLPLLRACISEILEVHLETIGERKEFELDCDSEAMNAVLSMLGNPRFVPDGNCAYFHMNDEQCAALMKKEYVVPDGFVVRRVDEKDFDVVIDTWKHLDSRTLVKERLRHLPSIGVYSKEGKLASFMSTHTMGQMSHVYTLPEFRGKGLGTVAEMRLAQDFIQRGLRPHKCVSFTNESVYAQSLRNPFYYEWKRPDGQHYCWNYNRIEYP